MPNTTEKQVDFEGREIELLYGFFVNSVIPFSHLDHFIALENPTKIVIVRSYICGAAAAQPALKPAVESLLCKLFPGPPLIFNISRGLFDQLHANAHDFAPSLAAHVNKLWSQNIIPQKP